MSTWPKVKLKELCYDYKKDIVDGPFGSNLKRSDFQSEGIPVLKIQNIKEGKILPKNQEYITPSKYLELKRHSFQKGDIVMTKLGSPLGVSAIVNNLEKGVIVADLVRIRAQKINTHFLCYFLNSKENRDFINSKQKGTTRPRVRLEIVRDLEIPFPAEVEQKRIVSILDKAFEEIEVLKLKQNRISNNLKLLFNTYIKKLFTNDNFSYSNLPHISTNLDSKRVPITKNRRPKGPYPYYGASGIVDNVKDYIFDENLLLVSEDGANLLARSSPIAFSVSGKIWVNNHAHVLRFNSTITQKFVEYYLESISLAKFVTGAAQPKLNQKSLNEIPIPLVSLVQQKEIVNIIERLDEYKKNLTKVYNQKLIHLEELKQSILHKAFNGEL